MTGSKYTSSELILELIRIISKPAFKRTDHEIELVLPWLRKRSELLQNQEVSVVSDIVKNCTILSCNRDELIIKQGDIGDCFYIVLRGSVSVYIDPKMTGESGGDDARSQASAKKKKVKSKPKPLDSEDSVLSGMEKPSTEGDETSTVTDLNTLGDDQEIEEEEEEEDGEEEGQGNKKKSRKKKSTGPLDRNKFGKMICEYVGLDDDDEEEPSPGHAFGELALVNRETRRNATVIVDDDADLMVIDQDLFDRSLRAEQEAKYSEIRDFIEKHPFFCQMNSKFKKLLEMSLRKEHYIFDTNIIKQGDPVIGLHFIISGGANISVQPKKHTFQYQHLWPFEAGYDQLSIEFEHLRDLRRAAILRKYEDPSVWETKPEELVIRREQGYAAIEKKMKENHINFCSVQAKEVLGDIETLVNLSTYMQTVRCTSNTTCFVLDTKNFERLVGKKNNPQTMDVMREYVQSKLHTRMNMRNADLIPLLGYLHQKLTEQLLPPSKKVEPFKTSKAPPGVDEEMQHLMQYFKEGKDVVLIKPCEPGVVYYRELMREKAKNRETQRKAGKDSIRLGSLRSRPQRKPRSMLQIRESLRHMMEAEVIEMETTKKFRKKKPKIQREPKDPMVGSQSSLASTARSTPRTLVGMQNNNNNNHTLPEEHKANRNTKPGLMAMIKAVKEKKDIEQNGSHPDYSGSNGMEDGAKKVLSSQNVPKSTPPVLVTEMANSKTNEPVMPAIKEEKTQEEIVLANESDTERFSRTGQSVYESSPRHANENASSFKDDTCREPKTLNSSRTSPVTDRATDRKKHNKTPTQLPPIKTPNTRDEPDSGFIRLSDQHVQNSDSIPRLPDIGGAMAGATQDGDQTGRTDDTSSTQSSRWQTAMTFVNQRINERLRKSIMEEETEYKDFETSEPSLKLLESRIRAFHVKYGMGSKTKNLPHLKRYKLDEADTSQLLPKPGGKVWVKKQTCRYMNSEYVVKDHRHVRYQMVEEIPEFERVKRSKIVVQQMLKTADFGDNDMF